VNTFDDVWSINIEEILSRANGNFQKQNDVLESSIIIIINYCIIIINKCTINAYYNYISNKGLLE